MKPSILIVDDNRDILIAARILLSQNGFDAITEPDPERIPLLLKKNDFSVVLLDMNFTKGVVHGKEGLKWLRIIKEMDPATQVILVTAYGDVELAVAGMRQGASDFVQKPWENNKLVATVSMAIELNKTKKKSSLLEEQNKLLSENSHSIIGYSQPMKSIFNLIDRVSATDANVLVTGENGTGKEIVARVIHEKSRRSGSIFLGVDMGSIPESLFESEMFGHERGAFTGAEKSRIGRLEAASGGTLFLDEIGNVPLLQQPKLLRVLETREVTPIGSTSKRPIDVRLISATNDDIEKMVNNNRFRRDLLYRINTVEIRIPPLRERKEDIPLLLDYFLSIYSKKCKRNGLTISPSAMAKLVNYAWPGNVRELSNLVERAVILSTGDSIEIEDFTLSNYDDRKVSLSDFNLEAMEKKLIAEAVSAEDGNLSRTASLLGITRATLYRKLKKYGI